MSSPVSWDVAQRVATWYSSGRTPLAAPSPVLDDATVRQLDQDFAKSTAQAEDLVVAATGLRPLSGPPRAAVVDRGEWARRNIGSFRRLLDPALQRMQSGRSAGPLSGLTGAAAGTQLGLILGWMGTRVLGQYDLLLSDDDESGDFVFYVGPNIVAMERRHGFAPQQFRLWIALHEVTHRCQFTAVPWLRPYYLSLVDQVLAGVSPDPARLLESLLRAARTVRSGGNPLEESGLLGLLAPPEQLDAIARIQALMSLLEGHGDITMSRAGAALVPDAERFARVLHERRSRAAFPARFLQQLLGIEAKLKQYSQGAGFITGVEEAAGPEVLAKVWQNAEMLPSMDEIRDPQQWVERVTRSPLAVG